MHHHIQYWLKGAYPVITGYDTNNHYYNIEIQHAHIENQIAENWRQAAEEKIKEQEQRREEARAVEKWHTKENKDHHQESQTMIT